MSFAPFNLKGIRNRVYAEADYAPSKSNEAEKRVNEFINRAYYRLLLDAPFLFFADIYQFPIYPDVVAGDDDTIRMASVGVNKDPWVFESVNAVGSTTTVFNTDGLWHGRKLLLYDSAEGLWHERRIREVWSEDDGTGTSRYYISIDQPWDDDSDISSWSVEMGAYNLPPSLVEVKSLMDYQSGLTREITIVTEGEGEETGIEPNLAGRLTSSLATYAYRREHRRLPAPTFDPVATLDGEQQSSWVGPEPTGSFEYCYTYVWGYLDDDFRMVGPESQDQLFAANETARSNPWIESPPSSTTNTVTHITDTAINVSLPDIDFVLGFGDATTRRYRRAGIKKRIYRRRVSHNAVAFGRNVEVPDSFHLIAEVDGHVQTWTDDGSQVPDYMVPLQSVHGYQTLHFYPRPSAKRYIRMRAIRRPPPLEDDQAFPAVHEEALDALINRTLVYLHKSMGNEVAANQALIQYKDDVMTLTKRYGTAVPDGTARNVGMKTTRGRRRSFQRWMLARSS